MRMMNLEMVIGDSGVIFFSNFLIIFCQYIILLVVVLFAGIVSFMFSINLCVRASFSI